MRYDRLFNASRLLSIPQVFVIENRNIELDFE